MCVPKGHDDDDSSSARRVLFEVIFNVLSIKGTRFFSPLKHLSDVPTVAREFMANKVSIIEATLKNCMMELFICGIDVRLFVLEFLDLFGRFYFYGMNEY